jgi:hypothetical protein
MHYAFNFGIPYANSVGSTTIAGWRVDSSDVHLPDLGESCLDEAVGLQDTAHPTDITHRYGSIGGLLPVLGPLDWNHDGNTNGTCLSIDLNGDFARTTLSGADDWAWVHSRLTPPALTNLVGGSPTKVGTDIAIYGFNLMLPATVIFAGGASTVVAGNQTNSITTCPRTPSSRSRCPRERKTAHHRRHSRRQSHQHPKPDDHALIGRTR